MTLFHSSILNLAKIFLDPLNNDDYSQSMGINVATLLQETNLGSTRWLKSASWLPEQALSSGLRAPLVWRYDELPAAPAAAPAVASALADASRPSEASSARASSSVGRNFLLDAGAGLYATNGLGGGSLRWFWPTYKAQGLTFDRILAWEASAHTAEEVFVPPAARPQAGMPRALADRISYYNLPVAAEPGALANPLRVLRSIATPDDFVVLKLDIDPRQDLEESLIGQILRDDATAALIDELYYEHHVHQSPMVAKGWGQGLMQVSSNQTLADSYAILTRLREKGIRTHSWI